MTEQHNTKLDYLIFLYKVYYHGIINFEWNLCVYWAIQQ